MKRKTRYGEKKQQQAIRLTPTAWRLLQEKGIAMGVSRNEAIEVLARANINLAKALKDARKSRGAA